MRYKKLLFGMLMFATLVLPTIATSLAFEPKSSQTTTINFWYTENDSEKPGLLAKVDAFMDANPDIEVVATQKGFFGVEDDYRTAFVAGNEPQLLRTPRDAVPKFANESLIQPVTSDFTQAEQDEFIDTAMSLVTYDGDVWGWPQALDAPAFFFNKHLFEEAGIDTSAITYSTSWTWDQFDTYTQDIIDDTDAYAISLAGMFYGAQPYYYGQGAYFFDDNIYDQAHIAINSTESRAALTYLKALTDSDKTPTWEEQGWDYFVGDFKDGDVAMIATGPWQILDLIDNSPLFNGTTYDESNLGLMQLPHDEDDNYGALIGGNYYTISANAEGDEYDAAVLLAEFLTSEESMATSAIENYHVPARESVLSDTDVMAADSYKYVQAFFEQCKNAFTLVPNELYGSLEGNFGNKINEYLGGDITLDQLITQTIALWNEDLPEAAEEGGIPGYQLPFLLFIGVMSTITLLKKTRK
jgi:arabinogalactan oligomer/maltooligosaccharide transport system substrate-binding protein